MPSRKHPGGRLLRKQRLLKKFLKFCCGSEKWEYVKDTVLFQMSLPHLWRKEDA